MKFRSSNWNGVYLTRISVEKSKKVAAFLNKSATNEQLDKITEHLKFDKFEKNEAVNNEPGIGNLGLWTRAESSFAKVNLTFYLISWIINKGRMWYS